MFWENNQLNIFIDWISVVVYLHLINQYHNIDFNGALMHNNKVICLLM